jgi:hypothetical protein
VGQSMTGTPKSSSFPGAKTSRASCHLERHSCAAKCVLARVCNV